MHTFSDTWYFQTLYFSPPSKKYDKTNIFSFHLFDMFLKTITPQSLRKTAFINASKMPVSCQQLRVYRTQFPGGHLVPS